MIGIAGTTIWFALLSGPPGGPDPLDPAPHPHAPVVAALQDAPDAAPALPPVVTPPRAGATAGTEAAPSDAILLFDGTSTAELMHPDGRDVEWTVEDGALVVNQKGPVITRRQFGDAQFHVEFSTPAEPVGEGQGRGNSGVYLQARYEVQVLDSFQNETYPDGQCGAIYGFSPPAVNASRGPGEWQTYDMIFRAARYDEAGQKTHNAVLTVFHNGVLIQDHFEIPDRTRASMWEEGPEPGPLYLQDHGNPVRYRNVWVRPLY